MTTTSPTTSREWSFGPIPTAWRTLPLKYLCSQSSLYGANVAAAFYENDGVRFLRTTDIRDDGTLNKGGVFVPVELVADYMLSDKDFLISRSGTVGRAYVYRPEDGPCAYAGYLVRYALRDPDSPRWLFYITKSSGFQQWLGAAVIEATIGNVNGEKYANLLVPVPPLRQRRVIVDYLDRETARLDALVAAKERVLGLLAEKRRALITRAVTRGLDPQTSHSATPVSPGSAGFRRIGRGWSVLGGFFAQRDHKRVAQQERRSFSPISGTLFVRIAKSNAGLNPSGSHRDVSTSFPQKVRRQSERIQESMPEGSIWFRLTRSGRGWDAMGVSRYRSDIDDVLCLQRVHSFDSRLARPKGLCGRRVWSGYRPSFSEIGKSQLDDSKGCGGTKTQLRSR